MKKTPECAYIKNFQFKNEFTLLLIRAEPVFQGLLDACGKYMDKCGSYLFHAPFGYKYCLEMYPK